MKTLFKLFSSVMILTCLIACNNSTRTEKNATDSSTTNESTPKKTGQAFIKDEGGTPNALQLAIQSEDHTTLVTAVQAAGVENALVNVGPLTVFAPNNAAFAKIDEATLNDLLKPENKGQLAEMEDTMKRSNNLVIFGLPEIDKVITMQMQKTRKR